MLVGDHLWVEPPNTEWGANVHLIDLRGAADVGDTVQCNCAFYAARTPGKDLGYLVFSVKGF